MNKKLQTKKLLTAICFLIISIFAFLNWESTMKNIVLFVLQSAITTFVPCSIIILIIIYHYNQKNNKENLINDQDGLERPADYIYFAVSNGVSISTAQTLAREFFVQMYFPNEANCKNLSNLDLGCFLVCVFVLVFYVYSKVKPVFIETFMNDEETIEGLEN